MKRKFNQEPLSNKVIVGRCRNLWWLRFSFLADGGVDEVVADAYTDNPFMMAIAVDEWVKDGIIPACSNLLGDRFSAEKNWAKVQ